MCLAGCSNPTAPTSKSGPIGGVKESCPTSIPKSCKDAPEKISLPKNVDKDLKDLYKNSFPSGKSQEQGGTLVKDDKGNIKIVNKGAGTSGTFSPDQKVGSGETIIGTVHTHPYDKSEGGHTGVSFSGADIAYANHYKEPIYVDAGDKQFMIMPTQETPAVEGKTLRDEWNKEYSDLLKAGKTVPDASAEATNKIAKKYKMAYYEGKDGELKRVSC